MENIKLAHNLIMKSSFCEVDMDQELNKEQSFLYKSLLIHEVIEEISIKLPNKTAIVVDDKVLTYSLLNAKANQLAAYLISLGIKCNQLIGLYLERSLDISVGILGVLKSGCAYVPIDPRYPIERIMYMLQDAQVSVLLTQENLMASIPDTSQCRVVNINLSSIFDKEIKKVSHKNNPSDLACVIYTSGTTGKPKGVMTTHANICNYVNALSNRLQISETDKYLHTASIAFSSSNRQLMLPFLNGCTVVMATSEDKMNPLLLFELIQLQEVTIIDLVPTYMRNCIKFLKLIDQQERDVLLKNRLRMILSASEALLSDIHKEWRSVFQREIKYINMYGLTETTGIIATHEIPYNNKSLVVEPIGYPIGDMTTYILDENLEPVPENDEGLLYISGPHLTLGYLNKPELTKKVFLENPFCTNHKSYLFKTGDICRYNSEGYIEYIGRADHQIKINGIRIEPKEIEIVLNKFPNVQESIVVLKEFYGEKCLAAYFVLSENINFNITELRKFIKHELPEHMIPSYFIALDSLPMTPNGKLDRLSLPDLSWNIICQDLDLQEPRNEMERWLAEMWKKILYIDVLGINQNFFELGGNSLLIFQVMSCIYDKFNINLSASILFEHPTISKLSKYLQELCNCKQNLFEIKEQRKRGIL